MDPFFSCRGLMASNLLEEKIPPQAIDAEMAVLGSMLLDAEAVTDALEILKPEHFYKESHQKIFAAMKNLADRGQAIDIITLTFWPSWGGKFI